MTKFGKFAVAAMLGASAVILMATDVSAAIVCNAEGDCWHVRHPYAYRSEFGVVVHPDRWRWGAGERFRFHEHTGRGYWRNGVWITF